MPDTGYNAKAEMPRGSFPAAGLARNSIDSELAHAVDEARAYAQLLHELADRLCGPQPPSPSKTHENGYMAQPGVFGNLQNLIAQLREINDLNAQCAKRIDAAI